MMGRADRVGMERGEERGKGKRRNTKGKEGRKNGSKENARRTDKNSVGGGAQPTSGSEESDKLRVLL